MTRPARDSSSRGPLVHRLLATGAAVDLVLVSVLIFAWRRDTYLPQQSVKWTAPHNDKTVQKTIDKTIDNSCSALFALLRLQPTPFAFLGLDPHAEPFSPVEESAHPGARWHVAARQRVLDAAAALRTSVWALHEGGDRAATAVVQASWHVGHMLTDDATRTWFLTHIPPRLETAREPGLVVRELCQHVWDARGWV
ncbi:hypothetical protein Ct61P_15133 [Colletotrichum tofieldiae]|nr:hypothetical protein Ct61P_15133 [Colletotrichum tofieldiae]